MVEIRTEKVNRGRYLVFAPLTDSKNEETQSPFSTCRFDPILHWCAG